jgi:hypothetical protein
VFRSALRRDIGRYRGAPGAAPFSRIYLSVFATGSGDNFGGRGPVGSLSENATFLGLHTKRVENRDVDILNCRYSVAATCALSALLNLHSAVGPVAKAARGETPNRTPEKIA